LVQVVQQVLREVIQYLYILPKVVGKVLVQTAPAVAMVALVVVLLVLRLTLVDLQLAMVLVITELRA
jgi:hypothetical protein